MKNKNLENYIKNTIPAKKSRIEILRGFKDEMEKLRKHGFTFAQISQYLYETYKIKTSRQTISEIINHKE